ncbi:TPA: sigma-70 family RNA polymerase sigma factor [Candidatus Poribacteria bacterium]|nr:sigma-70 family RNA polymerase sigma factor [Candidatus Poribacteria bacterium]HEX29502.1 sigma-70 family RNA polymerase sigma factor [Candidatus Poribacteria bacterium]
MSVRSIDAGLVEATLKGDREAFGHLVRKYRGPLLEFALKKVKNLADAEDIVQEAFLKAYQNLERLRDRDRFAEWLYRIVTNLCISLLRRRREELISLDSLPNPGSIGSVNPEYLPEQRELSEFIVRAVEALPDKSRRTFILYLEGFSYQEIADAMRVPVSTVSGRLQTAKRRLRERVSKELPFASISVPLRMAVEQLEEVSKMETILREKPLRRRIYGIGNQYDLLWENEEMANQNAVLCLFRGISAGRIYPDVFLENGARLYCPSKNRVQYSTPECDDIAQLIAHEKAGERILMSLALKAQERLGSDEFPSRMLIFKVNLQEPGKEPGCKENYLLYKDRISLEKLRSGLIPFLVTRMIFAGAGRVSDGSYLISQRAFYIEREISDGEEGIMRIPEEPLADRDRYLRLQVLVGDPSMSEWSAYLKIGTTALVLQMIEDGFIKKNLALKDPIQALRQVASDLSLTQKLELEDERKLTAVEIQREYLEMAKAYFDALESEALVKDIHRWEWAPVGDILERWEHTLSCLADDPMKLDGKVDWIIKRRLLESFREKHGLDWGAPELVEADMRYHILLPEEGSYYRLEREGKVERILTDERIREAMDEPPGTTRARFRAQFIKLANERKILCGVNWSYIQLYEPERQLYLNLDPLNPVYEEV